MHGQLAGGSAIRSAFRKLMRLIDENSASRDVARDVRRCPRTGCDCQFQKTPRQFASRSKRTGPKQRQTTKTVRQLALGIVTAMESGPGTVRKRPFRRKSQTVSAWLSLSHQVTRTRWKLPALGPWTTIGRDG